MIIGHLAYALQIVCKHIPYVGMGLKSFKQFLQVQGHSRSLGALLFGAGVISC